MKGTQVILLLPNSETNCLLEETNLYFFYDFCLQVLQFVLRGRSEIKNLSVDRGDISAAGQLRVLRIVSFVLGREFYCCVSFLRLFHTNQLFHSGQ